MRGAPGQLAAPRTPEEARSDRAVLLVHGLCSSSLEVRLFARTLREHGYHVRVATLPGYRAVDVETSPSPVPDYRRWIADARAELDHLRDNYETVSLCGVSLGATLSLAVAAEASPLLNGLSLISTTLFFDGWNVSPWRFLLPVAYYTPLGRFYRYREVAPYGVKNKRVRNWIAQQLAGSSLSPAGASTIPNTSLLEAERLIRHVKQSLTRVRVPTLMIHSDEDDVASLANVRFVRTQIGAQVFREVIVRDSYHMITLDNDRDFAANKTVQFFNDISARDGHKRNVASHEKEAGNAGEHDF
jgi:carboxylesterase